MAIVTLTQLKEAIGASPPNDLPDAVLQRALDAASQDIYRVGGGQTVVEGDTNPPLRDIARVCVVQLTRLDLLWDGFDTLRDGSYQVARSNYEAERARILGRIEEQLPRGIPFIGSGAVSTSSPTPAGEVADGSITFAKLDDSLQRQVLPATANDNDHLRYDSGRWVSAALNITASQLEDGSITLAKLDSGVTNKLLPDSPSNKDIPQWDGDSWENQSLAEAIGSGGISATEIAAGAVGSSELANNAVGSAQIANNAVGSSEIANNAVGTTQLDTAVTNRLPPATATTGQFLRWSGTAWAAAALPALANGVVAVANLATGVVSRLLADNPSTDDVPQYSGTAWANKDPDDIFGTDGAPVNFNDFENSLVFWDGKVDPTESSLKNTATRIGNSSGTPYSATDDRWTLNQNNGLRWESPVVDWTNFALCLRLEQSSANWACTIFWGSTTSTIINDGSVRNALGAMGAWIGRPTTATADGFDTTGWNIGLVSSEDETGVPWIDDFTVDSVTGASRATGRTGTGRKPHLQITAAALGDGPHDFIFNVFEDKVALFINGTRYCVWTLDADQRFSARGPYLGIAGDANNATSKILRLYEFVAVYPAKSLRGTA